MQTIGRYRVAGLLGKGGMGRVYKAVLPVVDKIVALKLLAPHEHMQQLLGSGRIEALFHAEARILAGIHHPHVASLIDFDYDQAGRAYFAMEYLCMNLGSLIGESYDVERPSRCLAPDRAARYTDQALDGLARLHHAGIIHRDIKPYNILLTDDDRVKIIDLGLSRLRGETRALPESFKIGTPFYAAPEQEDYPEQADERADLYSVGIMLWRMLTGTLPPEFGAPGPPSALNPLLGGHWDETLQTAIAADADKRFQDGEQMRSAVGRCLASWRQELEQTCRMPPAGTALPEADSRKKLRDTPRKVPRAKAGAFFGLDALCRPLRPVSAHYQPHTAETVMDSGRRLLWQQGASPYPLDWEAAHEFVRQLNAGRFGGVDTWRLPTVDELTALMQPKTLLGDYCQPVLFDNRKNRLWSSDKKSYTAAWYVDTELGFVDSQDRSCRFYVRAVAPA
ncbi:MAG TPA: protein kinase [Desulfosalsimonadaceae bacterium]|nr:protein kinase [Desulfosalsimonadaceae bacterium]